jgi:hypothetical protein
MSCLLISTEKKCHVSSQDTDTYVRYWHKADIRAVSGDVRHWVKRTLRLLNGREFSRRMNITTINRIVIRWLELQRFRIRRQQAFGVATCQQEILVWRAIEDQAAKINTHAADLPVQQATNVALHINMPPSTAQLYLKAIGDSTAEPDAFTSTLIPFSTAILNTSFG